MPPSIDENGCLYKPVALRTRAASRSQLSAVQQVATMRELAAGSRCSSTNVTPGKSSDEKRRDMFERVREKVRENNRAARLSLPPTLRLRGNQRSTQWDYAVRSGTSCNAQPVSGVVVQPVFNQCEGGGKRVPTNPASAGPQVVGKQRGDRCRPPQCCGIVAR